MVLDFKLDGSSFKSSIHLVSGDGASARAPHGFPFMSAFWILTGKRWHEICSRRLHSFSVDISPVAQ